MFLQSQDLTISKSAILLALWLLFLPIFGEGSDIKGGLLVIGEFDSQSRTTSDLLGLILAKLFLCCRMSVIRSGIAKMGGLFSQMGSPLMLSLAACILVFEGEDPQCILLEAAINCENRWSDFSGELSAGLPNVTCRFVTEMIFGVQVRGSVRLTEVGRALGERILLKITTSRCHAN